MDAANPEPEKPTIPPPDLPKPNIPPPSIPPPDIKPVSNPPPQTAGSPAVKVRVRQPGDPVDEAAGDGNHVPFHVRVLACILDLVLSWGIVLGAIWILPGFAESIAWLFGVAYFIARDSLQIIDGQSIGKKVMKIRVLTLDEKPLVGDWKTALIRNGVLFIPFFALIELYTLLSREERADRGKRLGDEWAKTKVVMAPEKPAEQEAGSEISP